MNRKIALLPEDLAAKIAAGEVVERPASVVKELVENAIDAGASIIDIELEEGGTEFIRVVDDGVGIDPEDVPLVFERHATSKISSIEDLFRLGTLGFRGEAMYSIAAVAKVELLTRKRQATAGTKAVVEGGVISEIREAGCPAGTSVSVQDLFGAVPARRKFLKKTATEQSRCVDMVTQLALAHYSVGFRLKANGRVVVDVRKSNSMTDRLYLLWGDDFRRNSLVINSHRGDIWLKGALSLPTLTRANRRGITCFVNGRPLRDSLLNQALLSAYRGLIEPRRYPVAVIFLQVPGEDVDVNVHPAKLEVRFRDEGAIFSALSSMVAEELARSGMRPPAKLEVQKPRLPLEAQNTSNYSYGPLRTYEIATDESKRFFSSTRGMDTVGEESRPLVASHSVTSGEASPDATVVEEPRTSFSSLNYLGQVGGTYLVLAAGDLLVLVDQHAAHERILFEKLKSSGRGGEAHCQRLLIPEIISMSHASYTFLMDLLPTFEEAGFEIEPYGENTVSVTSVPAMLGGFDVRRLLMDTLDEIDSTGARRTTQGEIGEKTLALMACKAAVMGRRLLSEPEVQALCTELDRTQNVGTCPHGRPVYRIFDLPELERLFKRR